MPASLGWQAYIVIMLDISILAITGIFFFAEKFADLKKWCYLCSVLLH